MKVYDLVSEVKWEVMDGDTELQKRVNAYLTRAFIMSHGMPPDECLREAKDLIYLILSYTEEG